MMIRLVASLLVLCLVFSGGSALAQTGEDNLSQMGNFSTETGISTLQNKTVSISQQPGGDVRWILPGERRLDPSIFGTPQAPLGFEPVIGVPVENRSISNNGTEFTTTMEPTPFSDNYESTNGTFYMNLTDRTPVDVKLSRDAAAAVFRFMDPTGKISYRVVLRNLTRVGQDHPVYGGVVIDGIAHGRTAIDTRLVPTSYVYGAFWGVGDLYINGTLVSRNRVMHAMATESLRSSNREGYRLLFDNELPHAGIETELLLLDMVMSENGTMQKEPVPTNYTLPNGQEQPFLNIEFEDSQIEGLNILDYNNTTVNLISTMAGNVAENETGTMTTTQTGTMTGNQTENMTGNMTGTEAGNMTEVQVGNITGNQTANITRDITGTMICDVTGNITGTDGNMSNMTRDMTGVMVCNITGNITEAMVGNQTQDITRMITGTMSCDITGNLTGTAGNMTRSEEGNRTDNQTQSTAGNQSQSMTENQTGSTTGVMTGDQTGMMTGTQTQGITQTQTGNIDQTQTASISQTQNSDQTGSTTGSQVGNITGNQMADMTRSTEEVTGNQTGNVEGNQTQAMTSNQTQSTTANQTQNVTWNMTGITEKITGNVTGVIIGNLTGKTDNMTMDGTIVGKLSGMAGNMTMNGAVTGNITGMGKMTENMTGMTENIGQIIGNVTGKIIGTLTGNAGNMLMLGNITGNVTGNITENATGTTGMAGDMTSNQAEI